MIFSFGNFGNGWLKRSWTAHACAEKECAAVKGVLSRRSNVRKRDVRHGESSVPVGANFYCHTTETSPDLMSHEPAE